MAALVVLALRAPVAEPAPTGLPQHFGIGLGASPDTNGLYGWMPNSGIPWDFAYQYLAGGVNTNQGWETWNSGGQFPLYYAQGAASHGYLPVFPYYELLQSNGTCASCSEAQRDLSNLNNANLMSNYYQNFALLMKRLGPGTYDGIKGFGGTVLIDVEPDLAGYATQAVLRGACFGFCTGQANDPTLLQAVVKSSGVADVGAYPDNYAGFNQALLHLRDLYAPNVLLGFHISGWATGPDIGSSTDPTLDAGGLGKQAGTFGALSGVTQAPAGTSTYDVLFNDPLDRDAGQYLALYGSNRWWDRLNVTFPNFHRWEQYLGGAVSAAGGKPMLLWQVPVGNQYFQTENNTDGHYQDNRVEYIFAHMDELRQVGVVGALFGPGNRGSTNYWDAKSDGITNPAPFCTTAGLSSGQICNTHVSTVSDDDGGYLRMAAQAYFASLAGGGSPTATPTPPASPTATATPSPVPSSSPTATRTVAPPAAFTASATASPAAVAPGTSVSITASVTSSAAATVLVDVEAYSATGQKMFQAFADNQSFAAGQTQTYNLSWPVPAGTAPGAYTLVMGIFSPGWGTLYAWNGNAGSITVAAAAATNTPTPLPASATPTDTATPTPTATPTNTATPTSTWTPLPPTPTATTVPQAGYTTGASVTPTAVPRGSAVALVGTVRSGAAATLLVDLEVYDPQGAKVFQQYVDNQSFAAGQTRTYAVSWTVPANAVTGGYTVKIGLFSPGWGVLYSWNNAAATFTVR